MISDISASAMNSSRRLHQFKRLARDFEECDVFEFARKRAEQFTGVEPVRTALFSDDWAAFGIACFYESLMEDTMIDARAFRDLAEAAEWLGIPVDVLSLKDEPAPHIGTTAEERS